MAGGFTSTTDDNPFGFAGLWETWTDKDDRNAIQSCTIITADASKGIEHLHNRMPVILNPDFYQSWLDPEIRDLNELLGILESGKVEELKFHPVSKDINSTRDNNISLIESITL